MQHAKDLTPVVRVLRPLNITIVHLAGSVVDLNRALVIIAIGLEDQRPFNTPSTKRRSIANDGNGLVQGSSTGKVHQATHFVFFFRLSLFVFLLLY